MFLYYVTHTITAEASHAIIARDEAHLLEILADREIEFRQSAFVTKFAREKGKIHGFPMCDDWRSFGKPLLHSGASRYAEHLANTRPQLPTWAQLPQKEREFWNNAAEK